MTPQANPEPVEKLLVREERIELLEKLVTALAEAARRTGTDHEKVRAALPGALSAECVRCKTQVHGKDLLVLAEVPAPDEPGALKRLRKGMCAREGCAARNYRIEFRRDPDLDWPKLLAARTDETAPEKPVAAGQTEPSLEDRAARRKKLLIRVAILFGLFLLALMLRQIYYGGEIPVIRKAEKFEVDPLPPGMTNH